MTKRILLATAALVLSLSPIAYAEDATTSDPIVAKVNGDVIHRSEVVHTMSMMGPQIQQLPPQMVLPKIVERMIEIKLLSKKGYELKLQNDPEVKQQLKEIETQLVAESYIHHEVAPKITDAKIKDFYDQEVTGKFKPQDEVRARHILIKVSSKAKPEDVSKAEAEANELIKKIKDGADFAKLATEKSQDEETAKVGGDVGYFTHDRMVPEFADAAFALKVGEVSDKPVKTSFGYHIIKLEDKRKSSPPTLNEVKAQIQNQLSSQLAGELIKSTEAKAKIERFNADGSPIKEGSQDTPSKK